MRDETRRVVLENTSNNYSESPAAESSRLLIYSTIITYQPNLLLESSTYKSYVLDMKDIHQSRTGCPTYTLQT